MKTLKLLSLLYAFLAFIQLNAQTPERKVLFIGIDGVRSDALQQGRTPNLDTLFRSGLYTYTSWHLGITVSGPSWSTMLTGVWENKHGVTNNNYTNSNYNDYPYFITRVKEIRPTLKAVQITSWGPMSALVYNDGWDSKILVNTDADVVAAAQIQLLDPDLDVLFTHIDDVDAAGHGNGFSTIIPAYMNQVQTVDGQVRQILSYLRARPGYINGTEDWLILLTTDHGGIGFGHGGNTTQEKEIWWAAIGSTVPTQQISVNISNPNEWLNAPVLADIAVTALDHLLIGVDPEAQVDWDLDGKSWCIDPLDTVTNVSNLGTQMYNIRVFPNPSKGSFKVLIDNAEGKIICSITDITGREIISKEVSVNANSFIDFEETQLPKGIYFVKVTDEQNKSQTQKIIIN